MHRTPVLPLPPLLTEACQQLQASALEAARRSADGLGLASLAATQVLGRDALRAAQFELGRKLDAFALAFGEALQTEVARQFGLLQPLAGAPLTPQGLMQDWASMRLVEDREMELHVAAERLAQRLAHACEWELRELDTYLAALMGLAAADPQRNPLRAEVLGRCLMQAVDAVAERSEVRSAIAEELGRSWPPGLQRCFATLVGQWRSQGVRPVGLVPRSLGGRGPARAPELAQPQPTAAGRAAAGARANDPPLGARGRGRIAGIGPVAAPAGPHGEGQPTAANGPLHGDAPPGGAAAEGPAQGRLGGVDPAVMALLRRLSRLPVPVPAAADRGWQPPTPPTAPGAGDGGSLPGAAPERATEGHGPVAPNLIAQHRDALRGAAASPLDHLVIDLVAALFDQILADRRVPPQFARQLARLQMPVLRAALGDAQFFASRRHPVRQLVNRIASLATGCAEAPAASADALLAEVEACVQTIVEGDFDQSAVYQAQLDRLERFAAEQAAAERPDAAEADRLLARKEHEALAQAQWAAAVDAGLAAVPMPEAVRGFVREVWAPLIVRISHKEGEASPLAQRLRSVGADLVMSVQPKGSPALQPAFLKSLPQLMKDLHRGMDHARCPEPARQAFFGALLPAHAQALKRNDCSVLEHNLLAREVQAAFALPMPGPLTLVRADRPTPEAAALVREASFSPGEAAAVGLLLAEAPAAGAGHTPADGPGSGAGSVDLPLDLVLPDAAAPAAAGAAGTDPAAAAVPEAPLRAQDLALRGLPAPEPPEPTEGAAIAGHLKVGFSYRMAVQGRWRTVKLAHISPGRGFFVFTLGQAQREAVSLTHRMMLALAANGRLKALEPALLLDRATARVRRQLAQLRPAAG